MAYLDEEKYIEDGFIETGYFGGLLEGQGLFSYYFADEEPYIDADYFDNRGGFFVLTADLTIAVTNFNADLSSAFALVADPTKLVLFDADLTVVSTLEAQVGFLEQFDLSMVGAAEMLCEATVTRGLESNLTISTTASTAEQVFRGPGDIAIESSFSLGALGGYLQNTGVLLNSNINLGSTDYRRIRTTGADFVAFYSTAGALGQLLSDTANLISNFTLTAELNTVFAGDTDLNSSFNTVTVPSATRTTGADMLSEFATATAGLRIFPLSSDLNSEITLGHTVNGGIGSNVEPSVTFEFEADLTGAFSPSISANLIRTTDIIVESSFAVSAEPSVTRSTGADLSSSVSSTAEPLRIFSLAGDLTSTSELICEATTILEGAADLLGAFSPSITANLIKTTDIALSSSSTLIAEGELTLALAADLNTQFETNAVPVATFEGSAGLTVRSTLISAGGFLIFSAERTHQIPRETRSYTIDTERRTVRVNRETRTHIIEGGV